jgi:hypothetical protein
MHAPLAKERRVKVPTLLVRAAALLFCAAPVRATEARSADWTIRDGTPHVDETWVFLKIVKPLRTFAESVAHQTLADLPPRMEPVSITRVALPRDRPCPLAEA